MNKIITIFLLVSLFAFTKYKYEGDMKRAIYDADKNGVVDVAETTLSAAGAPENVFLTLDGNAYTNIDIIQFLSPFEGSIQSVLVSNITAPTGSDQRFDLQIMGTSIWSNTNSGLHVTNGDSWNQLAPNTTSNVSIGDLISIDILEVGSTVAGGNDVMILIKYNGFSYLILIFLCIISTITGFSRLKDVESTDWTHDKGVKKGYTYNEMIAAGGSSNTWKYLSSNYDERRKIDLWFENKTDYVDAVNRVKVKLNKK